LIPNAEAAPAIVNAVVLPLSFVSDVFVPSDNVPDWLRRVADFFPLKHTADAMTSAFLGGATQPRGLDLPASGWEPSDLAIVAAWGVFGLVVALLRFRWEPSR
jgi:ABC-2 type transport system permease protein